MIKKTQTIKNIDIFSSKNNVTYPQATHLMEEKVRSIVHHEQNEAIWFLEHPSIYTAGTSAKDQDLLDHFNLPIYQTGRGGQYTYHGPGQLIIYVMINIKKRNIGVKEFVKTLEYWIIRSLDAYDIKAFIRPDRVGVWVYNQEKKEEKIAAIGIRIRRGVSFHGISINMAPNLQHFKGIVPCGLSQYGVTSLEKLGKNTSRSFLEKNMLDNIDFKYNRPEFNV